MLNSLEMKIAQSIQISFRHFLTPQTMYVTFPLKNIAVKNISGLVCLASGLIAIQGTPQMATYKEAISLSSPLGERTLSNIQSILLLRQL